MENKDLLNDWRPEETLCIIQQRVLITLMDRNINTVKKLSSVQQIKATNPNGEKAKVEELRLDINHSQQWGQLTTHNSTLRNMEISASLEGFTWFFLSWYFCSGFRGNQFWEILWPVLSKGSEVKIQWFCHWLFQGPLTWCVLQLSCVQHKGGLTKPGWSRRNSGVLFVPY